MKHSLCNFQMYAKTEFKDEMPISNSDNNFIIETLLGPTKFCIF